MSKLEEMLTEGVTLDADSVEQLQTLIEQEIIKARAEVKADADVAIAQLQEQHAEELQEAQRQSDDKLEAALDVAVDAYIAENEQNFVNTEEHARMKALVESVKTAFESALMELNENAEVARLQKTLHEQQAEYDALFERYSSLREETALMENELHIAKCALIFQDRTAELTESAKERVATLLESVDTPDLDSFQHNLEVIMEMEKSKENDEDDDEVDNSKEKPKKTFVKKPLHEMTLAERLELYKS